MDSTFARSYSLRIYLEADLGLNAFGIPLGHPTDSEYLDASFLQLEMGLQLSGVSKQRMMFRHAIAALPSNATSLVFDIIGDAPEDLLKRAVISRLSVPREKRKQLFALVELGDRSPQLLRHMRLLASGYELNDEILKELWVRQASGTTLRQPDVITERQKKLEQLVPAISSCGGKETPTYGYDAKKCQPECNYLRTDSAFSKLNPTGPENLLILSDNNRKRWLIQWRKSIQSVQTETRDSSQELPDLADDSSSINGDIHNLLSEHSIISTKKRNKRKRKMAKPTVANQQNISKSVTQNRRPKHKLLLWRLARKHHLIHIYPSLDSKNRNFNKKDKTQAPVLQRSSPSTCEHFQKLHRRQQYCKPSNINSNRPVNQRQH
nr:gag pol polyprotein [Hymenolepis microstoma]